MLLSILQQIILSFILIAVIHYIYEYFKNNLTEPKIKDLVNKPKEKYEQLYNNVSSIKEEQPETNTMKDELQNYLKELSKNNLPKAATAESSHFDNNYQSL